MKIEGQRLEYIDWLRGYAILLVVFGHCWQINDIVNNLILAFHMPLFFYISGILFKHTQTYEKEGILFIINKFKQLIVPYLLFELLNLGMSVLLSSFMGENISVKVALQSIFLCIHDSSFNGLLNYRFWFFPALFITECLLFLLCRLFQHYKIEKKIFYLFAAICCVSVSFCMQIILEKKLPFTIDIAIMALAYMCLGYISKEIIAKCQRCSKRNMFFLSIVLFMILLGTTVNNVPFSMYINEYGNYFMAVTGSLAGIALSIIIVIWMNPEMNKYHAITWCSRNSLLIYPVHLFILAIVKMMYNKRSDNYDRGIATVLYFGICMVGSYFVIEFVLKRLKRLFTF